MIVIDIVVGVMFLVGLASIVLGVLGARKPKPTIPQQIVDADRIMLQLAITDDIMTILPANLRREIDKYTEMYIHGGNK